jgi:DNA-binding MarR family transcriptional regulator
MPAEASTSREVTSVLDDLRRIFRALREGSRAAEREIGLSGAQLFVLRTLAKPGHALSLNALAERTKTHQSSVSVVVTRLVRRRLVSRKKSNLDGRQLEVALTDKGRTLLAEAPATMQDRLIRSIERLPSPKRQGLALALQALVESMGLQEEPAAMFGEREGRPAPAPRAGSRARKTPPLTRP